MPLTVTGVLDAAEMARRSGSVFLCAELLQLAEVLIPEVDHAGSAVSRLALQEIADRMPIGAVVSDACSRAADRELRHVMLTGRGNR